MEGRVVQGILNEREADGQTQYKVRFKGLGKEDDAWVSASEVDAKQVSNFQLRKAKKSGEGLKPVKTITKEKKREAAPAAAQGEEGEGSEGSEPDEAEDESEAKRLEREDDGIPVGAGEVDAADIITGPRRQRQAAVAAQQSSEWGRLSNLEALADSDSD
jgi:hypothetical protein